MTIHRDIDRGSTGPSSWFRFTTSEGHRWRVWCTFAQMDEVARQVEERGASVKVEDMRVLPRLC